MKYHCTMPWARWTVKLVGAISPTFINVCILEWDTFFHECDNLVNIVMTCFVNIFIMFLQPLISKLECSTFQANLATAILNHFGQKNSNFMVQPNANLIWIVKDKAEVLSISNLTSSASHWNNSQTLSFLLWKYDFLLWIFFS